VVGKAAENFSALVKPWEDATGNKVTMVPMPASTSDQFGQYRLWLAAGSTDIDIYQTDVIWAPQLADHFLDLSEAAKDLAPTHFPSIIRSLCQSLLMRRRCIIARICWTNTAWLCRRPGTS
jgi:trehalose/maltose transport system substrate-binding protein